MLHRLSAFFLIFAGAGSAATFYQTYGGSGNDRFYDVIALGSGGYLLCGETASSGSGEADTWILMVDSLGAVIWEKTFGGTGTDYLRSAAPTTDGGFVLAGATESFGAGNYDFWILRINSSGDTLWTTTYGGAQQDIAQCVRQTPDLGYIVGGTTYSWGAGYRDGMLLRLNASGVPQWHQTYGSANNSDKVSWVHPLTNGHSQIAGSIYSDTQPSEGREGYFADVTSTGSPVWQSMYGTTIEDEFWSATPTTDGFCLIGYSHPTGGDYRFYIVRTNFTGGIIWEKTYGGSLIDTGRSILQTVDGGFAACGHTQSFGAGMSDVWLLRLNSSGDTLWTATHGGVQIDQSHSIKLCSDGGFAVAGFTVSYGTGGSEDGWFIKTNQNGQVVTGIEPGSASTLEDVLLASPNPFSNELSISYSIAEGGSAKLAIFDLSGHLVHIAQDGYLASGSYSAVISGADLPAGVFLVHLEAGGSIHTQRVIHLD